MNPSSYIRKFFKVLDNFSNHPHSWARAPAETPLSNQASSQMCSIFRNIGDIFSSLIGGGSGSYDKGIIDKIKQNLHILLENKGTRTRTNSRCIVFN